MSIAMPKLAEDQDAVYRPPVPPLLEDLEEDEEAVNPAYEGSISRTATGLDESMLFGGHPHGPGVGGD